MRFASRRIRASSGQRITPGEKWGNDKLALPALTLEFIGAVSIGGYPACLLAVGHEAIDHPVQEALQVYLVSARSRT